MTAAVATKGPGYVPVDDDPNYRWVNVAEWMDCDLWAVGVVVREKRAMKLRIGERVLVARRMAAQAVPHAEIAALLDVTPRAVERYLAQEPPRMFTEQYLSDTNA